MGNVIICGDFNGRIGLNSDFVENDEKDEFLPLPKDYEPGNVDLINRKSRDPEHDLKGNGQALLEFCRMSGFRVANGRIGKDQSEGNITCYNTKGNSIVDYLLIKEKDFIEVKDFEISEINEHSDHCYLNIKLHVNFSQNAHETTHEISSAESTPDDVPTDVEEFLKNNYMYKYQLTETSYDKICETLNSDKLKDELLNLDTNLNDISVTEAVSNLRQILIKISNESLKKTRLWTDSKHKPKNNYAPWMNGQSKQSKAKLNRARKKYQNAIRSDRTASYLLKT